MNKAALKNHYRQKKIILFDFCIADACFGGTTSVVTPQQLMTCGGAVSPPPISLTLSDHRPAAIGPEDTSFTSDPMGEMVGICCSANLFNEQSHSYQTLCSLSKIMKIILYFKYIKKDQHAVQCSIVYYLSFNSVAT